MLSNASNSEACSSCAFGGGGCGAGVAELVRWSIVVAPERLEEAYAALLDAFPDGIAEIAVDGGVEVSGYLPPDAEPPAALGLRPEPVADGWRDAWRAFHGPVEIAGTWVRPS